MIDRPVFGQRTLVMGIINVTPDSFSGDGVYGSSDPTAAALEQARRFVEDGADILDIGGESTRPDATQVSEKEELARVLPVLEAIKGADLGVVISVDTYKAGVAEACLESGADWLNDVWGLRADPEIAASAAKFGVPVVLMHNRSKASEAVLGHEAAPHYINLLEDVKRELLESVALARKAGIPTQNIILDPGIGFGKTVDQNLELIDRLNEIRALGFPVLLGPSRKSFIGYTLDLPADQRLEGTAAAVAAGIMRGADIIRVHDVKAMVRVARMTDAIVRRAR